jgi:formamidopyrimidine-DNA glycosylase
MVREDEMPELPEVEIFKEELCREVVGRRVEEAAVFEKTGGRGTYFCPRCQAS